MIYLGAAARGRENNLNLIRASAATAVLVSHAWPIALGGGADEPLSALMGHSLGTLAVYAFFIISGFLITASFARRQNPRLFVQARALRLFPGLFASLLLVGFVLGPIVTDLPLASYLTNPEVPLFVLQNMLLVSPAYTLPGVFETNPWPTVEGSIWTLVYEVACYLGVLIAGLFGVFRKPHYLILTLFLYLVIWLVWSVMGMNLHPKLDALHRLSFPFAIGVLFFALRDRIPLTAWLLLPLITLRIFASGTAAAEPAMALVLGYAVLWLAYVPRGHLLAYNRLGDYSYGIYIYAFPLQGAVIWFLGPMTAGMNIAISLPITLLFAALSWHLIEAPALRLRRLASFR